MRTKTFTFTVVAESTTHMATGLTGVGPFTSFTRTAPSDGLAHQLSFTSAANLSAITLTVVGTDENGAAVSEAVTGPNIATVESTNYFRTLTSITASATLGANTLDVGVVDEVRLQHVPLDHKSWVAATYAVEVTGTINYTGSECFVNILNGATPVYTTLTALSAKTATVITAATLGATSFRVTVNSYSSGATLKITVNHPKTP